MTAGSKTLARNPYPSHDAGQTSIIGRNPVLHEADPHDLEAASDELRARTMTLERDDVLPSKKLLLILLGGAAVTAFGTVVFREELKALFGLG